MHGFKPWPLIATLLILPLALALPGFALAAGTLTPVGSPDQPMRIVDHHVEVVINNGFARTEVTQTFANPNARELEAIYAFPVPQSASLSEVTIQTGEKQIDGEVISKQEADRIYGIERDAGNDAGKAQKNENQTFEFMVSRIAPGSEARLRFVYYEPLEIDTGVGRYHYPLEDGGTDDEGASFWNRNEQVDGTFSARVVVHSAHPVSDVRVPGFGDRAQSKRLGEGEFEILIEEQGVSLDHDLVVYYRLQDDLPGRVELIPYRADPSEPGHFMLVVTPGIDLAPITRGSDFVFVLDTSGSMEGKIQTLARGVARAIGELRPEDRFRVVEFNSRARELTAGWQAATPENVARNIRTVESLAATGSTNLFEGLQIALDRLDDDRATSIVLVTDAVTNTGVVDPRKFHELLARHDVRFFGFLLGNSGGWPLMRALCNATGGFYANVSNADDVLGQILLAKSKVTHEALHDVSLKVSGVKVSGTTGDQPRKIFRGQQLVIFGQYESAGTATVKLHTRITGEDRTYATSFDFPDVALDHPEVERLYGMARIEDLEDRTNAGLFDAGEAKTLTRDLGLRYQLVSDETSMIVLSDDDFARYGIRRDNAARVETEHKAQARRAAAPPPPQRVDRKKPMFSGKAPRLGGGGAIDPLVAALGLGIVVIAWVQRRRERDARS